MNYLAEAVSVLRPGAEFLIQNDTLVWLDDPALRPTDAEIEVKKQELMLQDAKEQKAAELKAAFDLEFNQITGDVLYHEMVSWYMQDNEARAYLADPTAETPFIDNLLVARGFGETKDELCQKIVAHAMAYKTFYPQLLGKYQNLMKKLEQANNILDVQAITW